jgi:hypothetical protein
LAKPFLPSQFKLLRLSGGALSALDFTPVDEVFRSGSDLPSASEE